MEELGLFPLPIVLLPSERIPLHIFEERYQELIGECIAGDTEFGLVYADDLGLREIGTRARVEEVLTRFEDGRLNVLVVGGSRFRLGELTTGRSFGTGLVSPVDDDDEPPEPSVVSRALASFERLRAASGSDVEAPSADSEQLSFELAARVELPADDKLELLAELSERRRLEKVVELLDGATVRAERVRIASKRASTNGRVELG